MNRLSSIRYRANKYSFFDLTIFSMVLIDSIPKAKEEAITKTIGRKSRVNNELFKEKHSYMTLHRITGILIRKENSTTSSFFVPDMQQPS